MPPLNKIGVVKNDMYRVVTVSLRVYWGRNLDLGA